MVNALDRNGITGLVIARYLIRKVHVEEKIYGECTKGKNESDSLMTPLLLSARQRTMNKDCRECFSIYIGLLVKVLFHLHILKKS